MVEIFFFPSVARMRHSSAASWQPHRYAAVSNGPRFNLLGAQETGCLQLANWAELQGERVHVARGLVVLLSCS